MKFLSVILSLYLFSLAAQPALTAIGFSTGSACCSISGEQDCEDEKQQQDNTCNGICNPLLGCGACAGFTFSFSPILPSPVQQATEHIMAYYSSAILEIALPIWQPPKIS